MLLLKIVAMGVILSGVQVMLIGFAARSTIAQPGAPNQSLSTTVH